MPHVPPPPDPEAAPLAEVVGAPPSPPPPPELLELLPEELELLVELPVPAPSKQLPLTHCCPSGHTTLSQGQLPHAPVFGSQQLPSTHVGLEHRLGAHAGVGWV